MIGVIAEQNRSGVMRLQIRQPDDDVLQIGEFATYGDALTAAIETLRNLEGQTRSNRPQWVEIYDGDDMRFSVEVGFH